MQRLLVSLIVLSLAAPASALPNSTRRGWLPDRILSADYWVSGDYGATSASGAASAVRQRIIRTGQAGAPSQATASKRPAIVASGQNGRTVLRCTRAAATQMTIASPTFGSSNSILLVASHSTNTNSYYVSSTGNVAAIIYGFTAGKWQWFNGGADQRDFNPSAATGWHSLFTTQVDGQASGNLGYLDATLNFTVTPTVALSGKSWTDIFDQHATGASPTADFGELVHFAAVLSATNRARVLAWAKLHWGTP